MKKLTNHKNKMHIQRSIKNRKNVQVNSSLYFESQLLKLVANQKSFRIFLSRKHNGNRIVLTFYNTGKSLWNDTTLIEDSVSDDHVINVLIHYFNKHNISYFCIGNALTKIAYFNSKTKKPIE